MRQGERNREKETGRGIWWSGRRERCLYGWEREREREGEREKERMRQG